MKNFLKILRTFLKSHGYQLNIENSNWVLSSKAVKIYYESFQPIEELIWHLFDEDLNGLDLNILSDPAGFDEKFPNVPSSNEVRSLLLNLWIKREFFHMLSAVDDRILRICMVPHYQIVFQTKDGKEEDWGFHKSYIKALHGYRIEGDLRSIRYYIDWFAGRCHGEKAWKTWFQDRQIISFIDEKGNRRKSELRAPQIGSRSIDAAGFLRKFKDTDRVEINFSNFYDHYEIGTKFHGCKIIIQKI